jgi:hypothetical protein
MPTLIEDFKFLIKGNVQFQQMVRDTLPLCSESERRMLTQFAGVVEQKLKEVEPQIAELQGMFEADLKEMNGEIKKDEAQLAELQARMEALKTKMAEVPPAPAPPPEPPLPGMGDSRYGRSLADDLLGLLGSAEGVGAAPKDPGDVWELMSSDWKIDEAPKAAAKPPTSAPPAPSDPQPRKGKGADVWELESHDWNDAPPSS